MTDVYNFFSHSAKRLQKWIEFQEMMDIKPYHMLRYVDTRWLSLEISIERIVNRFKELIEFVTETAPRDAEWMIKMLLQPQTRIYLQFLLLFLGKINKLNVSLQSNTSMISKIIPKLNDEGKVKLKISENFENFENFRKCEI